MRFLCKAADLTRVDIVTGVCLYIEAKKLQVCGWEKSYCIECDFCIHSLLFLCIPFYHPHTSSLHYLSFIIKSQFLWDCPPRQSKNSGGNWWLLVLASHIVIVRHQEWERCLFPRGLQQSLTALLTLTGDRASTVTLNWPVLPLILKINSTGIDSKATNHIY